LNPIEQSLELELRQERVQRAILALHDAEDWAGLRAMAEKLNQAWHNETGRARWLAKQVASNPTQGRQTGVQLPNLHDSPDR